ncbi:syncollin-like [Mobula hypostoma]|uniref:syncollin-like n=1 Tax=Mobula hypostoma TaxID=723540 RepID=UPI002FC2B434
MVGLPLAVWALCVVGALSQCPEPSVLRDVNGVRVCARFYRDSHTLYDQCCGGGYFDVKYPADVPSIQKYWDDRVSSLVVGPRCQLTVWDKKNKEGHRRTFRTGVQFRLEEVSRGFFGNWDNSISSYYCECS